MGAHSRRQAPQFFESEATLTSQPSSRILLQSSQPATHFGLGRCSTHSTESTCIRARLRSNSHPSNAFPLQSAKPASHFSTHARETHSPLAEACGRFKHVWLQAPQAVTVSTFVSQPLEGS